jgi:hypothetical protein
MPDYRVGDTPESWELPSEVGGAPGRITPRWPAAAATLPRPAHENELTGLDR